MTVGTASKLPNPLPRPDGEREGLEAAWRLPRGWRIVTAVNNTVIGYFYIATAFGFFLLAGVLALLMRTQLAVPGNSFLAQETYNQIFTMHGTVMMFLFAVPAVEAMGVLLLPQMLGARDLPFPRLGAFAFWTYLIGGSVFFCTVFLDLAPAGGWFMYPPLTGASFSPGVGADFWLLGIGFIEISAIAGAIEIIVGVLKTRAPGMTLGRLPIFAWTLLIFAGMIIFAFPAVILATILLELERAFDWPFFIAARGGDPLLWQHLFWFFGHPEVYIIFLPAAGMVSLIVPTMARIPIVGYRLIVIALIATGFFSFGLWVHHMFTTGIPPLSLGFFSAASMAVSVPSGIQVFAWIATIAAGRLRLTAASLFVLGFLITFTIGGLTGVMVAMVPFDWQAHDSYFVVAHLHYVLFGGMVFPLFAAFYYWAPAFSRRPLSETLGRWSFALIFSGFNITFLPMHLTGLRGMPRRISTYPSEAGWETLNLVSSAGTLVLAIGIGIFLADLIRNLRPSLTQSAGNIWNAGTLEWIENHSYGARSTPRVTSRDPLWSDPLLSDQVQAGAYYLPGTVTGGRETLVTSPLDGEPQYIARLTGPGWAHLIAAVLTAAFFLLLTVKAVTVAVSCGIGAVAAILVWLWQTDPPDAGDHEIGGGLTLPTYASGGASHSRWGVVVLLFAAAALFLSYGFAYLYLWTVASAGEWGGGGGGMPAWIYPLTATSLFVISAALVVASGKLRHRHAGFAVAAFMVGIALMAAGLAVEILGWKASGLQPTSSAYAAVVAVGLLLQVQIMVPAVLMAAFAGTRFLAAKIDRRRTVVLDNGRLFGAYAVGQNLLGVMLLHGIGRLVS